MKHEIIKTENYLLIVDDSEIKEDDLYFELDINVGREINTCGSYNGIPLCSESGKKIIAHLPLNDSPILEGVPLLPPLEQEDDVDKLAGNLLYGKYPYHPPQDSGYWKDMYKEGYNKAKEIYKFTEEDMRKIFTYGKQLGLTIAGNIRNGSDQPNKEEWFNESMQSILQPKMPTHFEWETFETLDDLGPLGHTAYPTYSTHNLTTTNAQRQVVACGKYIYE